MVGAAVAYAAQGKCKLAQADYEQALKIDPELGAAQDAMDRLGLGTACIQ